MEVQVSFRGKPLKFGNLGRDMTLLSLKEKLEEITSVPIANQKLIFKGKALHEDSQTLDHLGIFHAGAASHKPRLMLVGSTASEVDVARGPPPGRGRGDAVRNDLDGIAIPKGYKRVSLKYGAELTDRSPFRFQQIKTLPGLPREEEARGILEELAADPGVRAVMEKHRWTVGTLCELYPEGKVGVSRRCVMGLNVNHGQEIKLRIRTDNLMGFRKILSIRKVLFHELAHNVYSEHNDDFYRLMRQVEHEVAELDWRQQNGRTAGGKSPSSPAYSEPADARSGGGGYVLVKEAFEGGSGRLGGESDALTHIYSARELAGQAAVLRLTPEEQEVEDGCGHSVHDEGPEEASTSAAKLSTAAPGGTEIGVSREEGIPDDGEADVTRESGDGKVLTVEVPSTTSAMETDNFEESKDVGRITDGAVGGEADMSRGAVGSPTNVGRDIGTSEKMEVDYGNVDNGGNEGVMMAQDASASSSDIVVTAPQAMGAASAGDAMQSEHAPLTTHSEPLDALVAMGFPADEAAAALAAAGGSIPEAAMLLLASPISSSSGQEVEGQADGAREATVVTARLSRDVRLQQAARKISEHGDQDAALGCTDTLIAVFRNIMEHPDEEKFRRIRRSNGKLKASVLTVSGGEEVLLAAGFEQQDGDQLALSRQDPGLIWLAKSTMEACRVRLETAKGSPR